MAGNGEIGVNNLKLDETIHRKLDDSGIVADVEKGSKQVPIISQEYTSTLEDLIKKRIKDEDIYNKWTEFINDAQYKKYFTKD
jgi:U3 small nucleolar ribonucleoprotein component